MTVEQVLGRVEELCKERGWSHYTLAKESKMATSSVYNMFKRKTIPKIETLERVCAGFQITLGEFFLPEDKSGELTGEDKIILDLYHSLPMADRKQLMKYGEFLKDQKGK